MKLDRTTVDRFLNPRMLRALERLPLYSRRVMEGATTGSHRSPMKGFSNEFADHREYVKGDDLKHLDWKVYSRTERYYIKQYEESTNLSAHVMLDASGSMNYPRRAKQDRMTKYEYACHVAAGLSYVLTRQQDPVGLLVFNDDVIAQLPPMRSMGHLRRMLRTMDEITPDDRTDAPKALHTLAAKLTRRGLVILISDLLDEPDRVAKALAHFRQRGHDAIVIQVLDEDELTFPFERTVTFRDLETRERMMVNGSQIAAMYNQQLTEFLDQHKQSCFEHNFDYVLTSTATPCESMLTSLLTRRQS